MKNTTKTIALFLTLILVFGCGKDSNYEKKLSFLLEKNLDLRAYSTVVVIPGAGCAGCISHAESFFRKEKDRDDHLFVFTNIASLKTLTLKLDGLDLESMSNVILDKNNIFSIQDAPENIYPHLVVVYDGRVVEVNLL